MQFVGLFLVHAYFSYLTDSYEYFAGHFFWRYYCLGNSGLFDSAPPLRHDALAEILCIFLHFFGDFKQHI